MKTELLINGNMPIGISHFISLSVVKTLNVFSRSIITYKMIVDKMVNITAERKIRCSSTFVRFSEQSLSVEALNPKPAIIENTDRKICIIFIRPISSGDNIQATNSCDANATI